MAIVNKKMILPKLAYFLLFSFAGGFFPFIVSLMLHAGLTKFQAGFIAGMRSIFYLVGLMWDVLADYTKKRWVCFLIVLFATVGCIVPLPFISDVLCDYEVQHTVHDELRSNASKVAKFNVTWSCKDDVIEDSVIKDESCIEKQFILFITLLFLSGCFDQAILAYTDSLVVNYVTASEHPHSFGKQRAFGSIGSGLSSLIAGVAIDNNQIRSFPKHAPAFLISLASALCLIPTCFAMYGKVSWESNTTGDRYTVLNVIKRLKTFDKLFFLFSVLLMGSGYAIIGGYLYVFMTETIQTSDTFAGIGLSLNFLSEFVMFPLTGSFLKYLHGPMNCIALGSMAYFLRFILMSYTENGLLIISYQIFNAFSFALYWSAVIEKVRSCSSNPCLTTMIGIVTLVQFGCGNVLGNIAGGYLYDELGGRKMFRYISFVFLVLSIMIVCYEVKKKQSNRSNIPAS